MSMPLPDLIADESDLPSVSTREHIVDALVGYKREATNNRRAGMNPRDDKWRDNLDLYWNRIDFSTKAEWQSKNVMPEVPSYVDRFAAALKEALNSTPNGFYTVDDPYDTENNMAQAIKSMEDVWLSVCGRNQVGTPLDFSAVFEEQIKMGALMACAGVVLWRDDVPGGRVCFETVDPRNIWLDHTYRNLYRIRSTEMDRVDLARMLDMRTKKGNPIFNLDELGRLVAERSQMSQMEMDEKELSGSGGEVISDRQPIVFDEYIATVLGPDGKLLADNELMVVADDKYLVRGPEPIPYMHGKDFLLYTPLVTVPLSPYGRSYMEDFGSVAKIFTELTNLLLDATMMASMNAYAIVPSMLTNPEQANTGVWSNKTFMLEEGFTADEFAKAIQLGRIDASSVQIWQALKGELSEAAGMNEIGLGQLPDKTHIAATAVAGAQQSQGQILRSVANTVETRFLDPALDLIWKTGLQHAKAGDTRMANAVGPDMYSAMLARKSELIRRPITFQARGISGLIQRQQRLQSVLQIMQVIAQDQNLVAAFMQRADINKLLDMLFQLSNVDFSKLAPSARQSMIESVTQPLNAAAAGGNPSGQQVAAMGGAADAMGVARQ